MMFGAGKERAWKGDQALRLPRETRLDWGSGHDHDQSSVQCPVSTGVMDGRCDVEGSRVVYLAATRKTHAR